MHESEYTIKIMLNSIEFMLLISLIFFIFVFMFSYSIGLFHISKLYLRYLSFRLSSGSFLGLLFCVANKALDLV